MGNIIFSMENNTNIGYLESFEAGDLKVGKCVLIKLRTRIEYSRTISILICNIETSAYQSLNKVLLRVDLYLFTCKVKFKYISFSMEKSINNGFFRVFRSL